MAPYGRRNLTTAKKLLPDVAAARSASWLAVCHVSCWASSVILGAVSIWLRLQATQGVEQSVFGKVGIGLWASLPYAFAAALSIRASTDKSYSAIRLFFVSSILSLACSIALLAFSCLVVAMEASVEVVPKRVIVAGVLAGFSLLEVITSVISCVSCYTSIGCFDGKAARGEKKNGGMHRSARISPGDEDAGHVTVMALPARQAAELFYSMYKPFFPNNGTPGFNLPEASAATQEQFYRENYENEIPVSERRRRHRHRPRQESREYDAGYPPETPPYTEPDFSDEEADLSGHQNKNRRLLTPHRQAQEEVALEEETTPPRKPSNPAPAPQDDPDHGKKRAGEPVDKNFRKTNETKAATEQKGKELKLEKEGEKHPAGDKETKEKSVGK